MNISRRNFIRHSLMGGAGLAVPSVGFSSIQAQATKKMAVRSLGNTGIKLPILSLGALTATPNLVKAALRRGVVHIDTAHIYTEGRNEVMLGKVLKEFPRDAYVIATKIYTGNALFNEEFPQRFERQLKISLERLQLPYVDIIYLQDITTAAQVLHQPTQQMLERLRQQGMFKHVGVATHANEPEVIEAAVKSNFYEVILAAYNIRQQYAQRMSVAIQKAHDTGIGVIAMKVMAGGQNNAGAALKWVLQHKGITSALMGCSSYDQLETDLQSALKPKMNKAERQYVENIGNEENFYCQNCPGCSERCKMKLPINHLMRFYMYAFGYKDPGLSKEFIDRMQLPEDVCHCPTCAIECISGFDLKKRILMLDQLKKSPKEFVMFPKY